MAFELDEQALLQVAGGDTRRVEFLNDVKHLGHFLFRGGYVHCEKHVVHDVGHGAAEVAVVVQVADDVLPDFALFFGQVAIGKLLVQIVLEGFFIDNRSLVRVVVGAVVVGLQLIGIVVNVLVLEVVGDVEFVVLAEIDFLVVVVVVFAVVGIFSDWLIVLVIIVFVRFFQGGIGFYFLLDALLKFDDGQLQQFHQLNLLRRQFQFLPLGLSQSLVVHDISYLSGPSTGSGSLNLCKSEGP